MQRTTAQLLGGDRQCSSAGGSGERHLPKAAGILALQAMFRNSASSLGSLESVFSWRPVQKCSPLGNLLQSLVLQELGSKLTANEQSAKLAGFKRNWTEGKLKCSLPERNVPAAEIAGATVFEVLIISPCRPTLLILTRTAVLGKQIFCSPTDTDFVKLQPGAHNLPLFKAQHHFSDAKAAEVIEEYRFYSIVCSSAVSWYIKALLSFAASAGRRPVLCPFI